MEERNKDGPRCAVWRRKGKKELNNNKEKDKNFF